ncbi:MAG: hypothetical protein JJU46_10380 [Balneolaceae bacterium]|nr:hypothetical protein [Balneolaceae bacterium]MCH8549530.1 hypothetical protein [Balneolaceae bacterium]
MTEEKARELLMDYLYDEMDQEQRSEFEKALSRNEPLRSELAELQQTRSLLKGAELHKPILKETRKEPDEPNTRRWLPLISGVAALFMGAILLTIAYTNITVGHGDGYFTVSFGEPVQQPAELSREDLAIVVEQIRTEHTLLAGLLIDELEQRQSEQLSEAITMLTDYYDRQRERDLMLISEGFYQLEEETESRFRERDEWVAELIVALANQ